MSGGPAIDAAGNAVGVIEAGPPDGSVTYLTPASDVASEPTGTSTTPTTTGTTPTPATPGVNAPSRKCDPNVQATPAASCPFAENVFVAVWRGYKATGRIPSSVSAYSPATGQTYDLVCGMRAELADVVCNNISDESVAIEFPLRAVQVYQGP